MSGAESRRHWLGEDWECGRGKVKASEISRSDTVCIAIHNCDQSCGSKKTCPLDMAQSKSDEGPRCWCLRILALIATNP